MSRHVFKLPDLGEGTVSAEIIQWHVKPGDVVAEDQPLVEMSTDKAVVEVPSPVSGRLLFCSGSPGDAVAVGAELAVFETAVAVASGAAPTDAAGDGAAPAAAGPRSAATSAPHAAPRAAAAALPGRPMPRPGIGSSGEPVPGRVMASPAIRRRARESGVDLATVAGSGPGGRILSADLQAATVPGAVPDSLATSSGDITEIPVIGVRRVIAQRMTEAKRNAPHFAYVEEVDVTALEALRTRLNAGLPAGQPPLTYLPFVVAALVEVLAEFPQCNAHYDAARNVIQRHRAVHVGIATQSPDGLKVPVVRDAARLRFSDLAAEIRRVTEAARHHTARRDELTGSTITVTSLGKLGGLASTPILNTPEVAIVGINKAIERPVVIDGNITIRRMMNLSSSFDHRFVDGFDAAAMIQALKLRLEHPEALRID